MIKNIWISKELDIFTDEQNPEWWGDTFGIIEGDARTVYKRLDDALWSKLSAMVAGSTDKRILDRYEILRKELGL